MSERRIFAWTDFRLDGFAIPFSRLDGFAIRPQRNRKDMLSHFKC